MYWLKACPRCHGDLRAVQDLDGIEVSCIQCGKYLTESQKAALYLATRRAMARATMRSEKVAA